MRVVVQPQPMPRRMARVRPPVRALSRHFGVLSLMMEPPRLHCGGCSDQPGSDGAPMPPERVKAALVHMSIESRV